MPDGDRVRVIHGAADAWFDDLGDVTTGVVQHSLADALNIPDDAIVYVNGVGVGPEYRLNAGDVLEFCVGWGLKRLGDLLTPDELMTRWHITEEQYRELIALGLPAFHFGDGTVRHPELAVDDWWRHLMSPPQTTGQQPAVWCNPASATPPPSHPFGPLTGTQKNLASWLYADGTPDARRLQGRASNGGVWVKQVHARLYEVWFRTEREMAEAMKRSNQTTPRSV